MICRKLAIFALPLAIAAQPLTAQDEAPSQDAAIAEIAALFSAEPLTAEQQARLPAAQAVVKKIMPPGTMGEVMGSMFKGVLDPLMKLANEPSSGDIAEELGLADDALDLSDEQAARAAAILDPAWTERREREYAAMNGAMRTVMTAMEPAMRSGMAEAYAVTFSDAELADIDRFFATSSGAAYARKSYALAGDPRIMGAAMKSLPELMGQFAAVGETVKNATADLPPKRTYADLTAEERRELARLTGLEQSQLAEALERDDADDEVPSETE